MKQSAFLIMVACLYANDRNNNGGGGALCSYDMCDFFGVCTSEVYLISPRSRILMFSAE